MTSYIVRGRPLGPRAQTAPWNTITDSMHVGDTVNLTLSAPDETALIGAGILSIGPYDAGHLLANTAAKLYDSPRYPAAGFGVVGDGVSDNGPALNSLIQNVRSAGGGVIDLPQGIIFTSQTLDLPSYVHLSGQGPSFGGTQIKLLPNSNCDVIAWHKSTGAGDPNAFWGGLWNLSVHGNAAAQSGTDYHHCVNATTNPLTSVQNVDPDFDPAHVIVNCMFRSATGDGMFANGRSDLRVIASQAKFNLGNGWSPSFDTHYDGCISGFNGICGWYLNHQSIKGSSCKSYNNGTLLQWSSGLNWTVGQRTISANLLYSAINPLTNDTVAPASDPTNWAPIAATSPQMWGHAVAIDGNGGEISFNCDSQQDSGCGFFISSVVGGNHVTGTVQAPNYNQGGGAINGTNPNHNSALLLSSCKGVIAHIAANTQGAAGIAFAKYGVGTNFDVHITTDGTGTLLAANSASLVGCGAVWMNGALLSPTLGFQTGSIWMGSGVPSASTTAVAGDYYFRTDTPSTANQRIYICTVGGATPTWVALTI